MDKEKYRKRWELEEDEEKRRIIMNESEQANLDLSREERIFYNEVMNVKEFFQVCMEKKPTVDRTESAVISFNHLFGFYPYENQSLVIEARKKTAREALEIFASQAEQYRDEWMEVVKEIKPDPEVQEALDAFARNFTLLAQGARDHAANLP